MTQPPNDPPEEPVGGALTPPSEEVPEPADPALEPSSAPPEAPAPFGAPTAAAQPPAYQPPPPPAAEARPAYPPPPPPPPAGSYPPPPPRAPVYDPRVPAAGYLPYAGEPAPQGSNGLAVSSLVTGLVGIPLMLFCFIGSPLSVAAVVLGVLALRRQTPGRGLAIAGIAIGGVTLALSALLIVMSMASAITQ